METYDERFLREYRLKVLDLIEDCERIERQADEILEVDEQWALRTSMMK